MARINGTFSLTTSQYPFIDYTIGAAAHDSGGYYHPLTVFLGAHKVNAQWQTYKEDTSVSLTVNGTKTSTSVNYDMRSKAAGYEQTLISSYTVKVYHTAALSVSVSGKADLSGTSAGSGSVSGTISLPAISVSAPTIGSVTATVTGTSLGSGVYAHTKNGCKLTANSVSAGSGASIVSYKWFIDDTLISTTSTTANYTFPASRFTVGSHTLKCTVTNSNGKSASKSTTITVSAYAPPKVSSMVSQRCTSGGTASDDGSYGSCKASFSYTPLGSNNASMTIRIYDGDTVIATRSNAASGTAYVLGGGSLDSEKSYVVLYEVTDAFGSVIGNDLISTALFQIDVTTSGKGMAFLKAAVNDGEVDLGGDGRFRGNAILHGALMASDKTSPIKVVPYVNAGTSATTQEALEAWLRQIVSSFPGETNSIYAGVSRRGSYAYCIGFVYTATAYGSTGFPQYGMGIIQTLQNTGQVYDWSLSNGVLTMHSLNRTTV